MPLFIYEYIFRLDVPVDDSIPVHFFDCEDNLCEVNPSFIFRQPALWLLVQYCPHISSRTVVRHHVEILECLEGVMQFRHELVVDLSLDFLFRDNEARQAIICLLLHALHRVKLARTLFVSSQTLHKIDLGVGTCAQKTYAFEVGSLHIKVAESDWP